jgi:hypothetical protein
MPLKNGSARVKDAWHPVHEILCKQLPEGVKRAEIMKYYQDNGSSREEALKKANKWLSDKAYEGADDLDPIPVETEDQVLGHGAVGDRGAKDSDWDWTEYKIKVPIKYRYVGERQERSAKVGATATFQPDGKVGSVTWPRMDAVARELGLQASQIGEITWPHLNELNIKKPAKDSSLKPIPVDDQVLGEGAVGDGDIFSEAQERCNELKRWEKNGHKLTYGQRRLLNLEYEANERGKNVTEAEVKKALQGAREADFQKAVKDSSLEPIPVNDTEWNDPKPRGSYKLTTSAALKTPSAVASAYGKKDPEGMKRSFGKDADQIEYQDPSTGKWFSGEVVGPAPVKYGIKDILLIKTKSGTELRVHKDRVRAKDSELKPIPIKDSFNGLVGKLERGGKSKEYATKIAGKVAAEKKAKDADDQWRRDIAAKCKTALLNAGWSPTEAREYAQIAAGLRQGPLPSDVVKDLGRLADLYVIRAKDSKTEFDLARELDDAVRQAKADPSKVDAMWKRIVAVDKIADAMGLSSVLDCCDDAYNKLDKLRKVKAKDSEEFRDPNSNIWSPFGDQNVPASLLNTYQKLFDEYYAINAQARQMPGSPTAKTAAKAAYEKSRAAFEACRAASLKARKAVAANDCCYFVMS